MKYRENIEDSKDVKINYAESIDSLIEKRKKHFEEKRKDLWDKFFDNQQNYREEFKKMLGWPLVEESAKEGAPPVKIEKLSDEDGFTVYRMEFDIIDGCILSGLFFKQETDEKRPLVIVQHGGMGTPELISGFYGNTSNYNDMLERVLKRGVHIFAPQLLLWGEHYGVKHDRNRVDVELKRLGSSITALEIYGIERILDYFEKEDYVSTFGMVGTSYGGFYTLYTSAVDERIKSSISSIFFNKRDAVPWSDWTWFKSAEIFDDAEVAALIYPRKLYIQIADKDELFNCESGLESFEKLKEICKDVGTDWLDFILFEGKHEFYKGDEQIEKLIKDLIFF